MKVAELEEKVKQIGFKESSYWIEVQNLQTSGLQVQSVSSYNSNLISNLANDLGFDYTHRIEQTGDGPHTVWYISFF